MAEDAVNAAVTAAGLTAPASRTRHLPLVGAAPRSTLSTVDAPERLVGKYGTEAPQVAALDRTPVVPTLEVTAGEVQWAVQQEGALDADDVLHRRTRIGLVPKNLAAAKAPVTELVRKALADPVPNNRL